jgi:tRNA-dihydrouridine synthase 1
MPADDALLAFSLFVGSDPLIDPVDISLEYLAICKEYPGTHLAVMQTHIRHFIEYQWYAAPFYRTTATLEC